MLGQLTGTQSVADTKTHMSTLLILGSWVLAVESHPFRPPRPACPCPERWNLLHHQQRGDQPRLRSGGRAAPLASSSSSEAFHSSAHFLSPHIFADFNADGTNIKDVLTEEEVWDQATVRRQQMTAEGIDVAPISLTWLQATSYMNSA